MEKDVEEIETAPLKLFELPLCPKCQLDVISYVMNKSTFYEKSNARMVPLSGPSAVSVNGIPMLGQLILPFAKWVCVRCGYTVNA